MTTKEKLQSLAQNSIVLDISEELEDYAPCSTHFGGRPDVPADLRGLGIRVRATTMSVRSVPLPSWLSLIALILQQWIRIICSPTMDCCLSFMRWTPSLGDFLRRTKAG